MRGPPDELFPPDGQYWGHQVGQEAGGKCAGQPISCDDGNPCTSDSCNPASGCVFAAQNGTSCGGNGVCQSGTCSPGSSVNPATSCKAIKAALPAAASGAFWIDPDGKAGAGAAFQVQCEMGLWGGGWMKIDNAQANALLTMTQPNPAQGKCLLTATEWRSWDGFDGAPGSEHLCLGATKTSNWPTYQELRFEAVVLTGYTGGTGNTFDLGTDCYAVTTSGYFCAGPSTQLQSPNTAAASLGNGVKTAAMTRQITLAAPSNKFEIQSHEQGPQLEGVIWNSGAIYLR